MLAYAAQRNKYRVLKENAENQIEEIHRDVGGPTHGGYWYEVKQLCKHFDLNFKIEQEKRENDMIKIEQIAELQRLDYLKSKEKQMTRYHEMEQFEPGFEETLEDVKIKKKER